MEVFPGGFVDKSLVEDDALKLAQFFLVQRADPEIADDLTGPALPFVTFGSRAFGILCHNTRKVILVRRECVTRSASRTGIPQRHTRFQHAGQHLELAHPSRDSAAASQAPVQAALLR